MSLQQDNAFKSPWKSTRPHAHVTHCHHASGSLSPAPLTPQSSALENAGQAGVPAPTPWIGLRRGRPRGPGLLSLLTAPGSLFPSGGQGDRDVRAGASGKPVLPQDVQQVLTDFPLGGCFCLSSHWGPEGFGDESREGAFFSQENKMKSKTPRLESSEA